MESKKLRKTSNTLSGLLDLKQILHLSKSRKHQLFLGQLHIYEDRTRSPMTAWRIPLYHSSLVYSFNFLKNIEILDDHLAELLCLFLLQWKTPHTQNWPIFNQWNTHAEMLNSWFPECVQTGTVVTIICVLLDMLLFRRGLPVGLFYLVSTLQTLESPIPKSEVIFWRNSNLWSGHTKVDLSEGLQPRKDQCWSNEKIVRSKKQQKGEQQRGNFLGCSQIPMAHPPSTAWGEEEV